MKQQRAESISEGKAWKRKRKHVGRSETLRITLSTTYRKEKKNEKRKQAARPQRHTNGTLPSATLATKILKLVK